MAKTIPSRKDVKNQDKWDLSSIFKSKDEWEKALASLEGCCIFAKLIK